MKPDNHFVIWNHHEEN